MEQLITAAATVPVTLTAPLVHVPPPPSPLPAVTTTVSTTISICSFFFKTTFYSSMAGLQCFISFRCAAEWFSYTCICLSFSDSFPL